MKDWPFSIKEELKDIYSVYRLPLDEIMDNMIDKWFIGEVSKNEKKNIVFSDEIVTVKRCNEETTRSLHGYNINPVGIKIMCPVGGRFMTNDKDQSLYNMKVQIHSIDDASFGIWFNQIPFETLLCIREQVKEYIDKEEFICGEDLLTYCETLGGHDKDYN